MVQFSFIFPSTLESQLIFPFISPIFNFISQYHSSSEKLWCFTLQKSVFSQNQILFLLNDFLTVKCLLVDFNYLSRELLIPILSLTSVVIPLSFTSSTNIHAFFVFKIILKNTLRQAGPVTVPRPFLQAGSTPLIHPPGKGCLNAMQPPTPCSPLSGDPVSGNRLPTAHL